MAFCCMMFMELPFRGWYRYNIRYLYIVVGCEFQNRIITTSFHNHVYLHFHIFAVLC